MLLTVLSGTIAGAEDFVEIRRWTVLHIAFLQRFLPFASGIPSRDTRNDIVNAIDGELFAACFTQGVASLSGGAASPETGPEVVAIDVVFHEDLNRLGSGNGPQSMAILRHITLDLLRGAKDKHSLKVRRKSAAWDPSYLEPTIRQTA